MEEVDDDFRYDRARMTKAENSSEVAGPAQAATPLLTEPPFFIVGLSRSGTTLLQNILSTHSRLAVTPETHFCKSSERIAGVSLDNAPPDFETYWQGYCRTRHFASLEVAPERCRAFLDRQGVQSFGTALAALLTAYLEKTGKRRIGEKTPGHFYNARWLFQVFPEARMIALQRDPRAMIASVLKTPWRKRELDPASSWVARRTRLHVVARDARRWAHVNGEILPRLAAEEPRVLRLRYEDLVDAPKTHVETVCAFLGERFEPAMLSDRSDRHAFDPVAAGWDEEWSSWIEQHNLSASAPVSTDSLERWRAALSAPEVATIEALAGDTMEELGYTDRTATPGARRRAIAAAAAAGALDRTERSGRRAARWLVRSRMGRPV